MFASSCCRSMFASLVLSVDLNRPHLLSGCSLCVLPELLFCVSPWVVCVTHLFSCICARTRVCVCAPCGTGTHTARRSLLGIRTARATDAKAAPPTSRTAALVADSQPKPPKAGDVVLLNGQPCRLNRVERPSLFQKFQLSGRHIFSGQRFETMCSPRVSWHSVRTPSAS